MAKPNMLLIAEKPDLMRQIEAVYRKCAGKLPYQIDFMSQRGHLVALRQPDELDESLKIWQWETLPFHPEDYGGWKYKVIQEKRTGKFQTSQERYEEIRAALKSGKYDAVINAGDPDQEGELLIRLVLRQAGNTLPVRRFWTNDLTEKAIADALVNLKDDDRDPMLTNLLDAAYGRQHSDYRFGMNLSRAATLKMGTTVSCGRVETPILAIVCRREQEIRDFKPSTSYGVQAEYAEGFTGVLFDAADASADEKADEEARSGVVRFRTREEAQGLIKGLPGKAETIQCEKKEVRTQPPKLFKLATAQIAAGKNGYNDAETLAIIQGLYEKKLLSYPRTDCEYLSSAEDFEGTLEAVRNLPGLAPFVDRITPADIARVKKSKRWVNDAALKDEGHSALKPTTTKTDFSSLPRDEQDIYLMVAKRFVSIFLPPIIQEQVTLIADAGGYTFRSTGKTLVDPGFAEIYGTKFTDAVIPPHSKGDILEIRKYGVTEKTTTCPKRFTSPDLVAACENPLKYLDDPTLKALGKRLKIGTPATRSGIIKKLKTKDCGGKYGYLTEKKEKKTVYIVPTPLGEGIIKNLGSCDICKVDLTGRWEEMLESVRRGALGLAELEKTMMSDVGSLVEDIKNTPMEVLGTRKGSGYKRITACPVCGKDIRAGEKGCFCSGWKASKDASGREVPGCPVWISREKWGIRFEDADFEVLLGGGEIEKTAESAEGNSGKIRLRYDLSKGGLYDVDAPVEEAAKCPVCGGKILLGKDRFYCTGPGTGQACNVRGWKTVCGAVLEATDVKSLMAGEEIEKECSKDGKSWRQKLVYNLETNKVDFVKAAHESSGYKCPCCRKSDLYEGEKMYRCMDDKCGFVIWKKMAGHELTADEVGQLVANGKTDPIDGFIKKDGSPFRGSVPLMVDKRAKSVAFDFGPKPGAGKKKK